MATPNNQFRLKLKPSTPYNFTIFWGDGTSEIFNETTGATPALAGLTHTYPTNSEVYDIKIYQNGDFGFPALYFNNTDTETTNDSDKVMEVVQWGKVKMLDLGDAFNNCTRLSGIPIDSSFKTLSSATIFSNAFKNCFSLNVFPDISTASATTFLNAWASCSSLSSFDATQAQNVIDIRGAWSNCISLSTFPQIDVSNAELFTNTWYNCTALNVFPTLNMDSAITVYGTWQNCKSLTWFPPIDFPSATVLYGAWRGCSSLSAFPLIDTSECTDFSRAWMDCTGLNGTNFPTLNMRKMKYINSVYQGGALCFSGVTLSTTSYSDLLIDLAANNLNTNVVFDGGGSKYNASGATAKATLVSRSWSITDGGPE